jgi:hypothetical protein
LDIRFCEHVERPGHVQQLDAGQSQDRNRSTRHHLRRPCPSGSDFVWNRLLTLIAAIAAWLVRVFKEIFRRLVMALTIGVSIPDSKLNREVTERVRDTKTPLLFHHPSRVYYFSALACKRRGLT